MWLINKGKIKKIKSKKEIKKEVEKKIINLNKKIGYKFLKNNSKKLNVFIFLKINKGEEKISFKFWQIFFFFIKISCVKKFFKNNFLKVLKCNVDK